ncbi:hypothetical protein WEI85_01905 [Actinomycetes bacterium KLBMP 9797]
MLLGIALMLIGAAVLLAMRHGGWPWRDRDPVEPAEPAVPAPYDYEAHAIYVPSERGTVYVSDSYPDPTNLDE